MTDPREANPSGGEPNTEATGDFQKPGTVGPSGEAQPDDAPPHDAQPDDGRPDDDRENEETR